MAQIPGGRKIGGQPLEEVRQRMQELMEPIDRQIMMTDDRKELLMLASGMLVACKEIFDQQVGEEARRKIFEDML